MNTLTQSEEKIENLEEIDELLLKTIDQIEDDPRFDFFLEHYKDPGTKEKPNPLFGNATQCFYAAFDPEKTRYTYNYARKRGHELVTKSNVVARTILEKRGLHYAGLLNLAANRAINTDNPRWWDIVAKHQGYDKEEKVVQVTNNTQINVHNLDDKSVKDFNRDFLKFLDSQ